MIILDATNRSLEVDLNGAVTTTELPVICSYVDVTTTTYVPATTATVTTGTTAITVAAAPAASTQRQIKLLTVYNADSVAAIVFVQYNNNTTIRIIVKFTLAVGDTLVYTDGEGFRVIDSTGAVKSSGGGSGTPGGSNTQVQFNNSSAFGGSANLTWDGTDLGLGSGNRARMQGQNRFRFLNVLAKVYRSANLTVTTGTYTLVDFNSEDFDTDGVHDNSTNPSRLTINLTGKYLIFGMAQWADNAVGRRDLGFNVDGANVYLAQMATTSAGPAHPTFTVFSLTAGQYIQMGVTQTSVGNLDLIGGSAGNAHFGLIYLGE